MAVFLILGILAPHASAGELACAVAAREVPNFQATEPPRPLPEIPFLVDGDVERTITAYRGKGVVLNFWATWCTPCVLEMPSIDRLHAAVAGDGIAVLALSEDRNGTAAVERFFRRRGIKNLAALIDRHGKLFHALEIAGLPTTLLVDAEGREVGRVVGPLEWDTPEALALVRACLGKTGP